MTSICPKPCSRLATSGIFIIIGVIQLLAGVILLRSKYADLLSGPDFMTGSTNVTIGSIYGTISSIWNISNKKKSVKINALKNVLASLLLSVIIVNTTAAIILIMGDGSRLLNMHLEKNKLDLASEILAYAYISSVFTPIFCIVVALAILSGRFIEICRDIQTEKAKKSIANDDLYNWVFDPNVNAKEISDTAETSSESSSDSEDSVFAEEEENYLSKKSVKNIPSPLEMWNEKRERILEEANGSQKQPRLDLVLDKHKIYDFSHERLIPRIKESSLRKNLTPKRGDFGKKSSKEFKSILKMNSSNPVSKGSGFHAGIETKNSVLSRCGEANDYENQENGCPEQLKASKRTSSNRNKAGKSLNLAEPTDFAEIHFIDPNIRELKAETLRELKQKVSKILPGAAIAVIKLPEISENEECMEEVSLEIAEDFSEQSHSSSVFSPENQFLSDKISDSFYPSRDSSGNSILAQSSYKNKGRKSGLSAISKIRSKSFDYLNEEESFHDQDGSKFPSMDIAEDKKTFSLDSQRASSSKQNKKFDTSRKMSMASIAEIPSEEDYYYNKNSSCSTSDFFDNSPMTDENSNRIKMSSSSRHSYLSKGSRRKSSITSSKLLKKMWSLSEPKINVSDLIVDKDSLIGLSEEELVARIRSQRKTVQDRLRKKREAEKVKSTYSGEM